MNLVFMNSMEKITGEQALTGQITICEQHGKWQVTWSEQDAAGKVIQEDWYDGTGWEEMMRVFRYRISEKLGEGFLPVLDGITDQFTMPKGREEIQQMILCYSDLNRNDELYEELRDWRRNTAMKENKAAYFIASNRLLGLISAYIPKTKEELKQLPGFGAYRMEHYAEAVLQITKKYERETDFPLGWVPEKLDRKQFTLWYYQQKQLQLRKERDEHRLKKVLLERIAKGAALDQICSELELPIREAIQWIEILDAEGNELDGLIEQEMGNMPDELRERALYAFGKIGDRYLKPILTEVYGESLPEGADLSRLYAWLRLLRIYYRRVQEASAAVS